MGKKHKKVSKELEVGDEVTITAVITAIEDDKIHLDTVEDEGVASQRLVLSYTKPTEDE